VRAELEGPRADMRGWSSRRHFYVSKEREMIVQLHQSLLGSEKVTREASTFIRIKITAIDLIDEKNARPSSLRDANSKSFRFGFRTCDRRAHNLPNLGEPAFIGFPVALLRPKPE
jgi:hypothetical protein